MKRTTIAACVALLAAPAAAQTPEILVSAYAYPPDCTLAIYATNNTDKTISILGRVELPRSTENDVHFFAVEFIGPGEKKHINVSFDGFCVGKGRRPSRAVLWQVSCRTGAGSGVPCPKLTWDQATFRQNDYDVPVEFGAQ